jgi:hypothetical protein
MVYDIYVTKLNGIAILTEDSLSGVALAKSERQSTEI